MKELIFVSLFVVFGAIVVFLAIPWILFFGEGYADWVIKKQDAIKKKRSDR